MFPAIFTEGSELRRSGYLDTSSSQGQETRDKCWSSLAVTFTKPGDTTRAYCGFHSGLPPFSDSDSEDNHGRREAVDIDATSDKGTLKDPVDN